MNKECAKLDRREEQELADEGIGGAGREQAGARPVLILSHDVFNERSGTVIAMALTSQEPRAGFPLTLELHDHKLAKRSWVKISQVRTLPRNGLAVVWVARRKKNLAM